MGLQGKERVPHIGDVYMVTFDGVGSEQSGYRPALIFQNNVGNAHSPNVVVLPLTSSLKKRNQPTHVIVRAKDSGLRMDSMVLCENPLSISKDRLGSYMTTLSFEYMQRVTEGSLLASSAISYLDINMLLAIQKKASALNGSVPV